MNRFVVVTHNDLGFRLPISEDTYDALSRCGMSARSWHLLQQNNCLICRNLYVPNPDLDFRPDTCSQKCSDTYARVVAHYAIGD